ncbi:M24 family metallopeptidase [Bradyrhizobium pachyrhizi]|uniref:M24 family metallopeptidase n=1 Tax=Bradyrhizobium pachyrhizi TaxID=280333 RepID=UPI00067C727E|nr:Xaa-Pro peptidase family protein [Bradyrhizobium pachyrhizi]
MASPTIPQTGVPFPRSEYERRHQKVLEAVERAEIDALVVTANTHLQYLTGYDPQGGNYFAPFPLILMPGRAPTFVVRSYDEVAVRASSCIDQIVSYMHRPDFAKLTADVLRQYGLKAKNVGFELDAWGLAPADVSAIQAQLPEMKVTDATDVVRLAKAVKGPLELELMRSAMAITDLAIETLQRSLRDGITETEMAIILSEKVNEAGGRLVMPVLAFGERNKLPHGVPTQHPIRNNEPALFEGGAAKCGYAAGVCRGAVLGRHPETEALHALAEEVLEAAIAAMKPGVTAGSVDAAARKVLERAGCLHASRSRVGYTTAPQWSGYRGNISLEPGSKYILEPGMTFHMPIHLWGDSGYIFGCSEHVLVTERGTEILSRTPHKLYRA